MYAVDLSWHTVGIFARRNRATHCLSPTSHPLLFFPMPALQLPTTSLDKGSLGELKSFGSPAAEVVQVSTDAKQLLYLLVYV